MGVVRRRSVMSAVVVLGLVWPSATASFATGEGSPPGGKRERLVQMHAKPTKPVTVDNNASGGPRLKGLALQRDTGKVVLSVKVRGGASAGTSLKNVAGAARSEGGRERRTFRQLGTVSLEVPKATAALFAAKLRNRAEVTRVDVVGRKNFTFVPNDENYAATAPYLNAVVAPSAWDVHRGDASVRIAVVDSGVDLNHPDLTGRVAESYNAVDGGSDVTDAVGHGTFVAGVAAASADNGVGIAGASMGSSVMAVKVADLNGQIWSDAEAAGIIWAADHGANVINLSLGSDAPDQVEADAVKYALGKGVLVVAAAGNDGVTTPSYPAAYPGVVAVAATDAAGHRASFSQYGSWVTVAAPGTAITSTSPTEGSAFFHADYDTAEGTSFSAPLVSAEAALLMSSRPGVTAADVRASIVASAHGYAGLGLGAGQVDFLAAMDGLRPDTVPALTTPGNGDVVQGQVTFTAQSAAAKVRFSVDGKPLGTPVVTDAGVASTVWSTWGLPNGTHNLEAVDCSIKDQCNTTPSRVVLHVANASPSVTSPKPSQTVSGSAVFTATGPGGAIGFVVDGVRRGLDTTAPYTLTYPVSSLSDGTHTIAAVSCSTAGVCGGPSSPVVSFKNLSLHPTFTAVSPGVISPNADGRNDSAKITYYLPDTEWVRYQVRNAVGTVVRGPSNLGTLLRGSHSFGWNGLLNGGTRAPSGAYKLELVTSRATSALTLSGSVAANIRVDLAAPTMSTITGSGSTVYPYPDTYGDSFSPAFALNEAATVTMTVRTGTGLLVRSIVGSRAAGRTSITWNGRNTAGALVGAGTYSWILTAQDPAGNRRSSAKYSVVVSSKRLVTRTATLTKNGAQYVLAGGSAASYCADADPGWSDFAPYGVWLSNTCDASAYGHQIAGATYRFTLPSAVSYSALRVDSYGNSLAPSRLGAGFTRWGTVNYTFTPEILTGSNNAWRTIGTVSPTGIVNSSRQVDTTLYVPNYYYDNDYDMGQVRLVVTYKILA